MNRQERSILAVVLVLIGMTAAVLLRLQASHKLGVPGVKVSPIPIYDPAGQLVATNSVELPATVLGYESEVLPVTPLELGWLPQDTTYGRRQYKAADGFSVALSVVLMGTDRTSIHKPQICLVGQGWNIEQSDLVTVQVSRPRSYTLPVMKLLATKQFREAGGEVTTYHGVFLYWFVSHDQITARHGQRMWWMARDLIRAGVLQRWAYVSYFSVCRPGQERATFERMQPFIAASTPEFQLTTGGSDEKQSSIRLDPGGALVQLRP